MKPHWIPYLLLIPLLFFSCKSDSRKHTQEKITLKVRQITQGPQEHFFGYIGHVQNIPWNESDRYILTLRVGFHDRMPTAEDVAEIVLLDTKDNFSPRKVAETRAWNPQQGTMMYWNPDAPETQFFFNDRDPETNYTFCVLFDIEQNKRIKEYRYEDTPFGNGGIRQNGGMFAGINYGRMARLRPVTGYPEAFDWNPESLHPEDDGIFAVDIVSGEKRLLVSFRQMRDALVETYPHIDSSALFINHTLWNRDGDRLYFFVRGNWGPFKNNGPRVNVPMIINADGTGLTEQKIFIGGHPEWELGAHMIGTVDREGPGPEIRKSLVLYDSQNQWVVKEIGNPLIFPDPEDDVALSPDAEWIVQSCEEDSRNAYTVFRRSDGAWARTPWMEQGEKYEHGPLRIDGAPKWNRAGNQVLFSSMTQEEKPTRQLFLIRVVDKAEEEHKSHKEHEEWW